MGDRVNDGSLAYIIVPSVSLTDFKKYSVENHVFILNNTSTLQAVYQKDIEQVQAVFFTDGKLSLPWNKLTIKMKKEGLTLIKKQGDKLIIDYSQPFPKKHIELSLDKKPTFKNDEIEVY